MDDPFQPPDGPTTEELAEIANVMPTTPDEAYAEGRRDQTDEFVELLPGAYYMDPPDGGSVTILEQMRRMAEDAARYRWLREQIYIDPTMLILRIDNVFLTGPLPEGLEVAIDDARRTKP